MDNNKYFNIVLFNITLFLLCFIGRSSQHTLMKQSLDEGDVCKKGEGSNPDHVCLRMEDCESLKEKKTDNKHLDVCKFDGSQPIVCCPKISNRKIHVMKRLTNKKPSIADDKCHQYSKLIDHEHHHMKGSPTKFQFPSNENKIIFGNCEVELQMASQNEDNIDIPIMKVDDDTSDVGLANSIMYPHMAMLGYEKTPGNIKWACGGSLISEKWILSAAQCHNINSLGAARWAHLGENTNKYRINHHVIHPCYEPSSYYNDIALFRLEKEVEFSESVRPICLNTDPHSIPQMQEVTGWGKMTADAPISEYYLSSIRSKTVPSNECDQTHVSNVGSSSLRFGTLTDRMICAVPTNDVKENCEDDLGNPLQAKLENSNVHTLFGIRSVRSCEYDKNTPAVYTRVSKYIPWIESIVWRYY